MFNRIKRLWQLTKKDPKALEVLEGLSEEQLAIIPEQADGKAEFLGSGTQDEWLEQQREDDGTKPWYERLRNL